MIFRVMSTAATNVGIMRYYMYMQVKLRHVLSNS